MRNSHAVHYYEVEWHTKSESSRSGKTRKTSFKVTGLKHGTMFEFRVRAFNKEYRSSDWSEWIRAETKTRMMKLAREAKAVAEVIPAMVGVPLYGLVVDHVAAHAVEIVEKTTGGKGAMVAAGTAAGIAGGTEPMILYRVRPLVLRVIGTLASMLVWDEPLSDQSDDEEEPPTFD